MNFNFLKTALLGGLLFVGSLHVSAQSAEDAIRYTQRMLNAGARSMGIGMTGRAGIGDWSATALNPAGLGWSKYSSFQGGLQMLSGEDESSFVLPQTATQTNKETFNTSAISNLGYLKKAEVARGSLAFGIGVNKVTQYDRTSRFSGENGENSITDYFLPADDAYTVNAGTDGVIGTNDDRFSFTSPISTIAFETYAIDFDKAFYTANKYPFFAGIQTGTVSQEGSVRESGDVNELSFAGAWEAARNVMVGASVNILFGNYKYRRSFTENDKYNDNDGTYPNDGTYQTVNFNSLTLTENLDTGVSGANLRLGLSTKLTENLKIGVVAETPTQYSIAEDYATILATKYDDGGTYEYGGLSYDVGTGAFDYRIATPWRLGAGVQFSSSHVNLFGDVEFTDWSKMKLSAESDRDYFNHLNDNIADNYQSSVQVALGGEFIWRNFSVRLGAGRNPDARKNPEVSREKTYASLGAGVKFGNRFELNAAVMTEMYDDLYLPYTDLSTFSPLRLNVYPMVNRKVIRQFGTLELKVTL
ncbi:MAG: hypothetical protein J0L94_12725 [Rhodothermia bacterium]|nr:hypothetical protein [Rhodothermia bacterium]